MVCYPLTNGRGLLVGHTLQVTCNSEGSPQAVRSLCARSANRIRSSGGGCAGGAAGVPQGCGLRDAERVTTPAQMAEASVLSLPKARSRSRSMARSTVERATPKSSVTSAVLCSPLRTSETKWAS